MSKSVKRLYGSTRSNSVVSAFIVVFFDAAAFFGAAAFFTGLAAIVSALTGAAFLALAFFAGASLVGSTFFLAMIGLFRNSNININIRFLQTFEVYILCFGAEI